MFVGDEETNRKKKKENEMFVCAEKRLDQVGLDESRGVYIESC